MSKSKLDILINARELIRNRKNWVRKFYGAKLIKLLDGKGCEVLTTRQPNDPTAECFCALGALYAVMNLPSPSYKNGKIVDVGNLTSEGIEAINLLSNFCPAIDPKEYNLINNIQIIADYNDNPNVTHGHILSVFDGAIASEAIKYEQIF